MMKRYYTVFDTIRGWVVLTGEDGHLLSVSYLKESREQAISIVSDEFEQAIDEFGDLPDRIRRYFEGEKVDFSGIKVKFEGVSKFQSDVLRKTMEVPYGELISYGELAVLAGSPGAARAVGTAMSRNPVPIVIPCHRVIHADGGLGGYGGGLEFKRWLLSLEGNNL